MNIFIKKQIERVLNREKLIEEIEKGLILYSKKKTLTAPTSFLKFNNPPGDVHIKSAAPIDDDYYIVKIASGFYDNPKRGLPSSNGLMLLFSQKTGELKAILLDEGKLTDVRTGLVGAICAKYLAPNPVTKIGIIGTGTQAREQLFNLQFVTDCRDVLVWGRNFKKAEAFAQDPGLATFQISAAKNIEEITQNCNLIVTTTPSSQPLIFGKQLKKGTHITAVGADDIGKQELDASVFEVADLIVADSKEQCFQYGDLAHAKHINREKIVELGTFIDTPQKRSNERITVADLTGLAIEDLQVAQFILRASSLRGGR